MLPIRFFVVAISLVYVLGAAQVPAALDDVVPFGPGVVVPQLVYRIEPEYSVDAEINDVQGKVLVSLTVDENGLPTDISVLRPVGFGLDEKAQAAVASWRFKPGTLDGKPIKMAAQVDVDFRLIPTQPNSKAHRLREQFDAALAVLRRKDAGDKDTKRALKSVREICSEKLAPAMYLLGVMMAEGDRVPQDARGGLALIQESAERGYGPAIYQVAMRRIEGVDVTRDSEWGLREMARAAYFGSTQAQAYLAQLYEAGEGLPQSREQAQHYYRLCAARGVGECQYHLGRLLLDEPGRRSSDRAQAVAWLQLAAERGVAGAAELSSKEILALSDFGVKSVARLKPLLASH